MISQRLVLVPFGRITFVVEETFVVEGVRVGWGNVGRTLKNSLKNFIVFCSKPRHYSLESVSN